MRTVLTSISMTNGESFKMKIDENGVRINAKDNDA